MIQFFIPGSEKDAILKQLCFAIDKGVRWIEIDSLSDTELIDNICKVCQEKGIILTVRNDIDFLTERRIHGLRLTDDINQVTHIRETLGGHPIIGLTFKNNFSSQHLNGLDIDYIVVDINQDNIFSYLPGELKNVGIPLVANVRGLSAGDYQRLIDAGFNGFLLSDTKDLNNLPSFLLTTCEEG